MQIFDPILCVLALDELIGPKRPAGHTKNTLLVPELEAILECQRGGRSPVKIDKLRREWGPKAGKECDLPGRGDYYYGRGNEHD